MGIAMYWEPVRKTPSRGGWKAPFRDIITKRFGTGDRELDSSAVEFLLGVEASASDPDTRAGARELVDAIEKYGAIRIFFEG